MKSPRLTMMFLAVLFSAGSAPQSSPAPAVKLPEKFAKTQERAIA